jgi:sulfide:quinone oxidoreductase
VVVASADDPRPSTVILGGGIAGLETLLALHDLAGELTSLTLVSPVPEFLYKPTTVEEPFTAQPAASRELGPILAELGATFVAGAVRRVDTERRAVELADGERLDYDRLAVCVGGDVRDAYRDAISFRVAGPPLAIDELIGRALADRSHRLAFVVPPGVSWPLPLYELALMTRRRADESARRELEIAIHSPEHSPLTLFGSVASDAVAELLAARRIEFHGESLVHEDERGALTITPGGAALEAGAVVSLPLIGGPRIEGLPCDEHGFIPIDDHARVPGIEDVWAAGDGTTFPVKQGGIGTQQADAAAEQIAASVGADVDPKPFHPVLRGQLVTAGESLHLRHELEGGHGEGEASLDYLWWPPHKVSGRYLAPWIEGEAPRSDPRPPSHPLDVEVSLPHEWHSQPMAFDPDGPPRPAD